jgi:hypothetical protein
MKIFIQGRKDGYNTLYPKPTPSEFYQFASDIQRIDAQNNSQYYGKSLFSISFNGSGCIFTKYIVGYDTLRSNIGNIGISVFMPSNSKMLGADVKVLLDDLVEIYTNNYCPDFKINNEKQEDWSLFTSAAENFGRVEKCDTDENFKYGSRDAAFVLYSDDKELEKYLESPYQEEYKEYKQILFVNDYSSILLQVVKHDQTANANLTGKIDLDNPSFKLREYHGQAKDGVSIEILSNGNKLLRNKDKIYRKDVIYIKYSKKYYQDKEAKGGIYDSNIREFLSISVNSNSIDVKKNVGLTPAEKTINIRVLNNQGTLFSGDNIIVKNFQSGVERQCVNDSIIFLGEEQKDRWTISARIGNFLGEQNFIPEHINFVELVLREVKILKLQVIDEWGQLIASDHNKAISYYDDEIRILQTITISVSGYHTKIERFIPKDQPDLKIIKLEKRQHRPPEAKVIHKSERKLTVLQLFSILSICMLIVFAVGYATYLFNNQATIDISSGDSNSHLINKVVQKEIEKYVEGDSLLLNKLEKYKRDWASQKPQIINTESSVSEPYDSNEYRVWKRVDESLDRAIKKRKAIDDGNFAYFKDSDVKFSAAQTTFRQSIMNVDESSYGILKSKWGNVSKLNLNEIVNSINKIIRANPEGTTSGSSLVYPENEAHKTNNQSSGTPITNNESYGNQLSYMESEIINYLKGVEFKGSILMEFKSRSNISKKLLSSVKLALEFWDIDNLRDLKIYRGKVLNDEHLKKNSTLNEYLSTATRDTKYPSSVSGNGTRLTLSNFINQIN